MCTERMLQMQKALIEKQAVWVCVLKTPLPHHLPVLSALAVLAFTSCVCCLLMCISLV